MLSASDVLDRLFKDDSDLSGLDSGGEEGTAICAYKGGTLDTVALREETRLDRYLHCKFVLDIARRSFCLFDSMEKILEPNCRFFYWHSEDINC